MPESHSWASMGSMHSPQTKAESGLAQAFCPQEGQLYLVLLRSFAPLTE